MSSYRQLAIFLYRDLGGSLGLIQGASRRRGKAFRKGRHRPHFDFVLIPDTSYSPRSFWLREQLQPCFFISKSTLRVGLFY